MKFRAIWSIALLLLPSLAAAQSLPYPINTTTCSSATPQNCTTWTPSQWVAAWQSKQNYGGDVSTSTVTTGGSTKTLATWLLASSGAYLPLTGGTLTGPLTLPYLTVTQGATSRAGLFFLPDSGLAPRREKLTWGVSGWILPNTIAASSPYTYFPTVPYPDDAYAVRQLIPILAATNGQPIGPFRFRPSSTFLTSACSGLTGDNYVNPCDPTTIQGGSGWNYLTFSEAGTDSDRVHQWGVDNTVTTLTLPNIISPDPETGATVNGRIIASDWDVFTPLQRSDVASTAPRVVMFRDVIPSGSTVARCAGAPGDTSQTGSAWTGDAALNSGYDYSVRNLTGDIETNTNVTGTAPSDQSPACWTQFLSRTKGIQIDAFGDSWILGDTTTSEISSFLLRAATQISTQALPVMYAGAGWSGASSAQYVPSGLDLIDLTQPSICVFIGYTANDTVTSISGAMTWLSKMTQAAHRCIAQGGKVIVVTPFPRNTLSGSTLTTWLYVYNEILGMGDANTYVFNATQLMGVYSGGAPTGAYNTTVCPTSDGIHPGDVCTSLILAGNGTYPGFISVLNKMIGIN